MDMMTFTKTFGTDTACRKHLEGVRWPDGPVCPRCGSVDQAVRVSNRPGLYRCRPCGRVFSVLIGTVMEGTRLPLRLWYLAMYLVMSTDGRISGNRLALQTGVQHRTSRRLLQQLRAMTDDGAALPLFGVVKTGS